MIKKERLEELIKNEATIYTPDIMWGSVGEIKLNKKMVIKNDRLDGDLGNLGLEGASCYCSIPLTDLVETKEEAEWYKEFGSIERTERLELPTWEEVSRDLENAPVGNYVIKSSDGWSLEYVKYNETVIGLYSEYVWSEWEATKENYILACRKAKELFLGEKK